MTTEADEHQLTKEQLKRMKKLEEKKIIYQMAINDLTKLQDKIRLESLDFRENDIRIYN